MKSSLISSLIEKGKIIYDVPGKTVQEVYRHVCDAIEFPENLSADQVYEALILREDLLSTAVGNGIALPHPRKSILREEESERIYIFFVKDPLDMGSPDGSLVSVFFLLLTKNRSTHLEILSSIAKMTQLPEIREKLINTKSDKDVITLFQ